MFIHDDLVKDASLNCCDKKRTKLQVYLVNRPSMRYDLKLFNFNLNLMEIMCLVQESKKCPVGWSKLMASIDNNWNM